MGEVLHEVDFNQLKIENQQYLEKIDDRNKDLLRLKLMTGNVLQVLNTYKVCSSKFLLLVSRYSFRCHVGLQLTLVETQLTRDFFDRKNCIL
jgi:hypothetical protein